MATVAADHTISQANLQWNSIGPQTTPSVALQGLFWSFVTQKGQQKAICKSRPTYVCIVIIFTVSSQ